MSIGVTTEDSEPIDRVAWAILAVGFALFLVYAWPGYMSIDSAEQLGEARAHHFTDWHPPAMAALWRLMDRIVAGPLGMLLLQSAAFFVGLYRLLRRAYAPRPAAVLATLVMLFPPVLAPMAVIWKDSQMAGYLLLGFSLLVDRRREVRIAGVLMLGVGTAMRYNAPAATMSLVVLVFEWRAGERWIKRTALALLVWIATVVAASACNKAITAEHKYPWHTALATDDIVGMLRFGKKFSNPKIIEILEGTPLVATDNLRWHALRIYTPVSWWNIANGDDRMFDWPTTPEHRDALSRAWKQLLYENPFGYLHHRWRVFAETLGLGERKLFAPYWNNKPSQDYVDNLKLDWEPTEVQRELASVIDWMSMKTFLFRPYLYFYLALLLVPFVLRQRDMLALLASGILYELTLFPFGTPDVRYSHWMMTTTLLTVLVIFKRRYGSGARSAGLAPTDAASHDVAVPTAERVLAPIGQ